MGRASRGPRATRRGRRAPVERWRARLAFLHRTATRTAMRVTFIDPPLWDYDCDTPLREPLGCTQSGVCYLTAELAARGVSVSVVNGVARPREVRGVHF